MTPRFISSIPASFQIIACGGGRLNEPRAGNAVEREAFRLTDKRCPNLLLIPTASRDPEPFIQGFTAYYRRRGHRVETLRLFKERPSRREVRAKVLRADLIYVGGGNTFLMMRRWKRFGVGPALLAAAERGTVLAGGSAGAICWFRSGNSDSRKKNAGDATLIQVSGLGWVDALLCPHYDSEKHRRPSLLRMMRRTPGMAIALEDYCAIEIVGSRYRILAARRGARAYRVFRKNGRVVEEKIPRVRVFKSLKGLLTRKHSLG